MKWQESFVGTQLLALSTSLPELASSINAVITQHADLALGAVVGSNIANLILVMAATTIIFPITNINNNQINQAWINIALGIALIFMSYFYFNFVFGIISLILLTFIMYIQIIRGSLNIDEINSYANDYAKTLNIWNDQFNKNWKNIEKLGFDEKFKLLWNYYLSYCEGGFLAKNIDLKQIKLNFNSKEL